MAVPLIANSGTRHYITRLCIHPLSNISNRSRQQRIHCCHTRKTGVRRSFAYIQGGTTNNLSTEMKYMYTNALASNISKMPEPFRTAVQNSRLWKSERSQSMQTTGCWPSLFPKDDREDVSFTIWCGNEDGEQLTKFFGGQLEISS
jgi:hypothetical protein